jgi:HAD superfamily hydrolase (TIGR01509 family)
LALQALIFDMDGLLFDTERVACDCWAEASGSLGFDLAEEIVRGAIGLDDELTRGYYQHLFAGHFPFDRVEARHRDLFRAHIQANGVPVKPGVGRILEQARQSGLRLALGTSSRALYTHAMLWLAGIAPCFQVLVTRDLVEAGKPAPDIYLKAAELLGVDPADCLVFEDSRNGIRAAKAAGMPVVMIPDLVAPTPELRSLCLGVYPSLVEAADRLVDQPSSLR